MHRFLTASLLAGCSVAAFCQSTPASACDIVPIDMAPTLQEQVDAAALVALVTVVAQHEPIASSTYRYDVSFDEIWKGEPLSHSSLVTQDTSCGFPSFDPGDQVLLMASQVRDEYFLLMGGGTDQEKDLRALLGPGETPESSPELFDRINPTPSQRLDPLRLIADAISATISTIDALFGHN